jgi:hypothetical protein
VSRAAETARRRHAARTWVRVAALLCLARALWIGSDAMGGIVFPSLPTAIQHLIDNGFAILVWVAAGAGLVLFERLLVRWLIPSAGTGAECGNCGYSLKNLKSPICPECGADVGPVTRVGDG